MHGPFTVEKWLLPLQRFPRVIYSPCILTTHMSGAVRKSRLRNSSDGGCIQGMMMSCLTRPLIGQCLPAVTPLQVWSPALQFSSAVTVHLVFIMCQVRLYVCMFLLVQSCLIVIPWTVACQAPLSMEFSRQEYWSGLPFPSPGDLPDPGINPASPAWQADSLPAGSPGKPTRSR